MVQRNFPDVVATRKQQRRVPVLRLTPSMVSHVTLVAVVAFALVATLRIRALLRARVQLLALIDILAVSHVARQLIPLLTVAVEALGCVHTLVLTSPVVHFAFALEALVGRLIRKVRAIRLLVADLRGRDAHAVTAIELLPSVTCLGTSCHVRYKNENDVENEKRKREWARLKCEPTNRTAISTFHISIGRVGCVVHRFSATSTNWRDENEDMVNEWQIGSVVSAAVT